MLDLRASRITTVKRTRVIDAVWAPSGRRIGYLALDTTPPARRAPPTAVRSVHLNGSGDRLLFALPFDRRRGRWASTLSWR